jgi:Na+(H+)/acetate symporter ActP
MAPAVVLSLVMASMALSAVFQGIRENLWGQVAGATLWLLVSAAMVAIPFAILVRTTEAYFRKQNAAGGNDDSDNVADAKTQELTKCLACGQAMPEDAGTCSACGWSFTDSDM